MTRAAVRPTPASLYVGADDRYVVSLVVACATDSAASARDAATSAMALLREGRAPQTYWCVYDRVADRVHLFEQRDLTMEEIDAA